MFTTLARVRTTPEGTHPRLSPLYRLPTGSTFVLRPTAPTHPPGDRRNLFTPFLCEFLRSSESTFTRKLEPSHAYDFIDFNLRNLPFHGTDSIQS